MHENLDDTQSPNSKLVTHNVRKLFKLGVAPSTPRGAPGRLSIAFGVLASAHEQWLAALKAEKNLWIYKLENNND